MRFSGYSFMVSLLFLALAQVSCSGAKSVHSAPRDTAVAVRSALPVSSQGSIDLEMSGIAQEDLGHSEEWSVYRVRVSQPSGVNPDSLTAAKASLELPLPGLRAVQGNVRRIASNQIEITFRAPPRLLESLQVRVSLKGVKLVSTGNWLLPAEAIVNPAGQVAAVYAIGEGGLVVRRPVQVLKAQDPKAILVSGDLQQAERVLLSGQHKVYPGQKVFEIKSQEIGVAK